MQPLQAPRDVTIPEPGSRTARELLSRAIRRAMQDLARLVARGGDPELTRFRPTLEQLMRERPGALAAVVRSPSVGALLRSLRRRAPELDFGEGVAELLALIRCDLAHLGALPEPSRQHRLPARILSLPARKLIEVPADARAAEFQNGELRFEVAEGWRRVDLGQPDDEPKFFPILDKLVLATVDNNPLSMFEAHPDKQGNAIDLGDKSAQDWTSSLRASIELIGRHLPDLRGELELYLQQIIPVGYDEHRHLSASYLEAIGTVYMTLHPQQMTMVEATIHEFQHNKLHALLELDPLLHNAFHPLYSSPVRPDPRPLQGVLLAVHAFQPVARLYQLMREAGDAISQHPEFDRRYRQIVEGNHEGASVLLEHGQPTEIGAGVLDEIRRWDQHEWL